MGVEVDAGEIVLETLQSQFEDSANTIHTRTKELEAAIQKIKPHLLKQGSESGPGTEAGNELRKYVDDYSRLLLEETRGACKLFFSFMMMNDLQFKKYLSESKKIIDPNLADFLSNRTPRVNIPVQTCH